eukprot:gene10583-10741_t
MIDEHAITPDTSYGEAAEPRRNKYRKQNLVVATSRFRGVCYNRKCKRWQASTNAYGKYIYLGLHDSEVAAARAYDLAVLKIRGSTNCHCNFPAHEYLDERGQLPPASHLDSIINQLKGEAATQMLQQLKNDDLALQTNNIHSPAKVTAVIRQRPLAKAAARGQEAVPFHSHWPTEGDMEARFVANSHSFNPALDVSGSSEMSAPNGTVSVAGPITCVNISWLQSALPPHCQLHSLVCGPSFIVGMIYHQASPAVPNGVLWGAAVWDGATFHHSQLCANCQQATEHCSSVVQQLVFGQRQSSCFQPDVNRRGTAMLAAGGRPV